MVLATSHGFRGAYLRSSHSLLSMGGCGEEHGERDYEFTAAPHAADLDDPERVGRTAGERAVKRLNPRKVDTHQVPVVFDTRVAGSLVGHLASAISGTAVARRTSFLKDKLGEHFASGVRIVDDPLRRRGLRSRPFDAEGVAGAELALVEDGVLRSWILDFATGRELGFKTTGQRGVSCRRRAPATSISWRANGLPIS